VGSPAADKEVGGGAGDGGEREVGLKPIGGAIEVDGGVDGDTPKKNSLHQRESQQGKRVMKSRN